tara:strand:- start:253 stop:399 length:147 start_codon:yes stop_codon:yes gene_type:complete
MVVKMPTPEVNSSIKGVLQVLDLPKNLSALKESITKNKIFGFISTLFF